MANLMSELERFEQEMKELGSEPSSSMLLPSAHLVAPVQLPLPPPPPPPPYGIATASNSVSTPVLFHLLPPEVLVPYVLPSLLVTSLRTPKCDKQRALLIHICPYSWGFMLVTFGLGGSSFDKCLNRWSEQNFPGAFFCAAGWIRQGTAFDSVALWVWYVGNLFLWCCVDSWVCDKWLTPWPLFAAFSFTSSQATASTTTSTSFSNCSSPSAASQT